jgi:hypothetical protein
VSVCRGFERQGLVDWEQDRPPDEHARACPDCLARRRVLDRLAPVLRAGVADDGPPTGWQARVFAALDRRSLPRHASRRRRWLVWSLPVVAAAAALLLLLRPAPDLAVPRPGWTVIATEGRRLRGAPIAGDNVASPGDRLKIWAPLPAAGKFEIRVFRGAELVFRCPPGCTTADGRLQADVPLDRPGRYEAFLAVARGDLPSPAPAGRAEDIARIVAAGGRIAEIPIIDAR